MKIQLLPSTFVNDRASAQQHLSCFIIDDCVALDAGSLATASSERQKNNVRDIVLTHAHLDHIAGLPLFLDDLFAGLKSPVRVYACDSVIQILENNIFNWEIYPKFSELKNKYGNVLEYLAFDPEKVFKVKHLKFLAIEVNHNVPSVGFLVSDSKNKMAFTGDTANTDKFWDIISREKHLDALLIECAFPDELESLAEISHHLTPNKLKTELTKFNHENCPVYVMNIKPMYYEQIRQQIESLKIERLQLFEVGKVYDLSNL